MSKSDLKYKKRRELYQLQKVFKILQDKCSYCIDGNIETHIDIESKYNFVDIKILRDDKHIEYFQLVDFDPYMDRQISSEKQKVKRFIRDIVHANRKIRVEIQVNDTDNFYKKYNRENIKESISELLKNKLPIEGIIKDNKKIIGIIKLQDEWNEYKETMVQIYDYLGQLGNKGLAFSYAGNNGKEEFYTESNIKELNDKINNIISKKHSAIKKDFVGIMNLLIFQNSWRSSYISSDKVLNRAIEMINMNLYPKFKEILLYLDYPLGNSDSNVYEVVVDLKNLKYYYS